MTTFINSTDRPSVNWSEFVAKMPIGKSPQIKDIIDRWSQYEEVWNTTVQPHKLISRRSLDNGEERAYQAWVMGLMEPEEERYFSMLTLRTDALVVLAVVPTIRKTIQQQGRILNLMEQLKQRVDQIGSDYAKAPKITNEQVQS